MMDGEDAEGPKRFTNAKVAYTHAKVVVCSQLRLVAKEAQVREQKGRVKRPRESLQEIWSLALPLFQVSQCLSYTFSALIL